MTGVILPVDAGTTAAVGFGMDSTSKKRVAIFRLCMALLLLFFNKHCVYGEVSAIRCQIRQLGFASRCGAEEFTLFES
jgi:hypothetical protein